MALEMLRMARKIPQNKTLSIPVSDQVAPCIRPECRECGRLQFDHLVRHHFDASETGAEIGLGKLFLEPSEFCLGAKELKSNLSKRRGRKMGCRDATAELLV